MLITPNQEKQFMEGDQKGDMGIKAKQVTAMLRVLISKIASLPIGVILTNHVYNSQDKYTPDQIAGGMMVEFSTSLLIQMNKYLLKEDEEGHETKEITGIRTTTVVRKSRYAKPFERIKINIPYETGMDPYSGLFELLEKKGCFNKAGSWYSWIDPETGEEIKHQGSSIKKWKTVMDRIMDIWETYYEIPNQQKLGFDETGVNFAEIQDSIAEIDELAEKIETKIKKGTKK
jgi:RecA/RadA recombinase